MASGLVSSFHTCPSSIYSQHGNYSDCPQVRAQASLSELSSASPSRCQVKAGVPPEPTRPEAGWPQLPAASSPVLSYVPRARPWEAPWQKTRPSVSLQPLPHQQPQVPCSWEAAPASLSRLEVPPSLAQGLRHSSLHHHLRCHVLYLYLCVVFLLQLECKFLKTTVLFLFCSVFFHWP